MRSGRRRRLLPGVSAGKIPETGDEKADSGKAEEDYGKKLDGLAERDFTGRLAGAAGDLQQFPESEHPQAYQEAQPPGQRYEGNYGRLSHFSIPALRKIYIVQFSLAQNWTHPRYFSGVSASLATSAFVMRSLYQWAVVVVQW